MTLATARNILIILVLAALVAVLPGGGTGATVALQAASLLFLATLGWFASVMYRQHRAELYSLGDRRRALLYVAVGVAAVVLTGTSKLWSTSAGSVAWLVLLFLSLFLTWSHQLPPTLAGSPAVRGVPRDPTAWQVYSALDLLLALLAVALALVARRGRARWARVLVLAAVALGLAFTAHAADVPPTNGVLVADSGQYLPISASPGAGETVAIVGLGLAAIGLLLSLALDRRSVAI